MAHTNVAFLPVLDFLHLDSLPLLQSPSHLCPSVLVLDLLAPDFLLLLQDLSHSGMRSSVYARFRLENTLFTLDAADLEVFLSLRSAK